MGCCHHACMEFVRVSCLSWRCLGRSCGGRPQHRGRWSSAQQSIHRPSSNATGTEVTQVLIFTERAQPGWCWGGTVLGALPAEKTCHSSPVAFTRHISQHHGPDLLPSMLPSSAAEQGAALVCRTDHFNLPPPNAGLPASAQTAGLLRPLAELCLVQALYLFSFSMHTSGALYRYKIIKMTVPR